MPSACWASLGDYGFGRRLDDRQLMLNWQMLVLGTSAGAAAANAIGQDSRQ